MLGLPLVEKLTKTVLEAEQTGLGEGTPGVPDTLRASLAARLDRHPRARRAAGEIIPEPALRFVADQLGTVPEALTTYAVRFQTRYEQLGTLRTALGFIDLTPQRRQILEWLLPVSLATTNPLTVATALLDELRRRRIIVPGPSIIERRGRHPFRRDTGHRLGGAGRLVDVWRQAHPRG